VALARRHFWRLAGLALLCSGAGAAWAQSQAVASWPGGPARASLLAEDWRVSSFLDGATLDDDSGPVAYPGAQPRALGRSQLRARLAAPQGWNLEAFVRKDARIWGQPGSLLAVQAARDDRPAAASTGSFPGTMSLQKIRRVGLAVDREQRLHAMPGQPLVRFGASIFAVDEFRSLDASGTLTRGPGSAVGLQAQGEENEIGATSPYIQPKKTLGGGVSFSVGLLWGDPADTHFALLLDDLGPDIRLPHVLRTTTRIDTATASSGVDGQVHIAPVISGQYSDSTARARQFRSHRAEAAWRLAPAWALLGRVHASFPATEAAVGVEWRAQQHRLQLLAHGGKQLPASLELAWHAPLGSVSFRADAVKRGKARVWGWQAQLRY
jgi:hypothetical protein